MQRTQSPLLRLWQLGRDHHGGLIAAIFWRVAGVLLGLLPYLSAGHILVALLTGQRDWNFYFLWCMVALGGYLPKPCFTIWHFPSPTRPPSRSCGTSGDGSVQNAPLTLGRHSGHLQRPAQTDRGRSGGEYGDDTGPPAAGDDLQSAGAVCVLVYLFTLDWRMALLSLVSIPVGMAFMMAIMGSYGKDYQGCGGDDPGHERDHCGVHRRH